MSACLPHGTSVTLSKTALKRQAILDAAADNDDSGDNDIPLDNSDDEYTYASDDAEPLRKPKRGKRLEETPSRRKPPVKRSKRPKTAGRTKLQFRLPATDEAAPPAHATASVMRAMALANIPPNAEALPSREVRHGVGKGVVKSVVQAAVEALFILAILASGRTLIVFGSVVMLLSNLSACQLLSNLSACQPSPHPHRSLGRSNSMRYHPLSRKSWRRGRPAACLCPGSRGLVGRDWERLMTGRD